jgi:hypothetical protein
MFAAAEFATHLEAISCTQQWNVRNKTFFIHFTTQLRVDQTSLETIKLNKFTLCPLLVHLLIQQNEC